MRIHRQAAAGLLALAASALVPAALQAQDGAQFSADMILRGPDGEVSTGKMYVGEGKLRMEMAQQGREVVRITDRNRRMEWILFPAERTYLVREAPPEKGGAGAAVSPGAPPSAETSPCAGVPGLHCRRAGVEDVAGRPAVKWEMSATRDGKTLAGAQWLDRERGIPLKSVMPNGQTMELRVLGSETVDGRQVEKWEMSMTAPGDQPRRTFQWYDPELKLAVRDELPGGYVNELKDIKVGPQPDDLFVVPAGYSRAALPQGGPPGAYPGPDQGGSGSQPPGGR